MLKTVEERKNFEKVTGGIQLSKGVVLDCDGMFVPSYMYAIFPFHFIHSSSSQ